MKKWFFNHLFKICLIISAFVQISFLFLLQPYFTSEEKRTNTNYSFPMTIIPYKIISYKKHKTTKIFIKKRIIKKHKPIKTKIKKEKKHTLQTKKNIKRKNSIIQLSQKTYFSYLKVDELPKPKTPINPKYPLIAKKMGIEGTVVLEIYIDKNGIVRKVILIKGIGFGCDKEAINKIKNTLFFPAKINNKPIAVKMKQEIEFKLIN